MFIEKIEHEYTDIQERVQKITLAFLASTEVQAYPCGRRRSAPIRQAGKGNTADYYIPFDPEARLNTEVNNRRGTSSNGYTDSYITGWDTDKNNLSFTVKGYNFAISDVTSINTFASELISALHGTNPGSDITKIYANIKLEEIPLYSKGTGSERDTLRYKTWVLRNQSASKYAENELDLLKSGESDASDVSKYFFSGLSFSTTPIVIDKLTEDEQTLNLPVDDHYLPGSSDKRAQHDFSLCIFNKNEAGEWVLYEPAKLPDVRHGETEDSVEVGHLNAQSIRYKTHPIAIFDINPVIVDGETFYQLHLQNADGETL